MSVYVDNQLVYPFSGMIPDRIHGGAPAKLGDDSPLDALTTLDLSQVEAIEVYKGVTGMPAVARGDSCAAIFIWTR